MISCILQRSIARAGRGSAVRVRAVAVFALSDSLSIGDVAGNPKCRRHGTARECEWYGSGNRYIYDEEVEVGVEDVDVCALGVL